MVATSLKKKTFEMTFYVYLYLIEYSACAVALVTYVVVVCSFSLYSKKPFWQQLYYIIPFLRIVACGKVHASLLTIHP